MSRQQQAFFLCVTVRVLCLFSEFLGLIVHGADGFFRPPLDFFFSVRRPPFSVPCEPLLPRVTKEKILPVPVYEPFGVAKIGKVERYNMNRWLRLFLGRPAA